MKELSIEEKIRRYDKAIEVISKCETDKYGCIIGIKPSDIFPELKESEGEKIRKALLTYFSDVDESYDGIPYPNICAWLEKQGEHANFLNKIQIGDKVTRNEDGMLVNLSQLNRVAKKDEKQGEQQDVSIQINPSEYINDMGGNGCYLKNTTQASAWSEEDEYYHNIILYILNNECVGKKDKENAIDWLKSIKDRYTWKPSDEQMLAINTAINVLGKGTISGKCLIELQEQLKKLWEE